MTFAWQAAKHIAAAGSAAGEPPLVEPTDEPVPSNWHAEAAS